MQLNSHNQIESDLEHAESEQNNLNRFIVIEVEQINQRVI